MGEGKFRKRVRHSVNVTGIPRMEAGHSNRSGKGILTVKRFDRDIQFYARVESIMATKCVWALTTQCVNVDLI